MNPPEKIFTHSLKEGILAGFAAAMVLQAAGLATILLLPIFRSGVGQELPAVGNTMASFSIISVLMLLAMIAAYRHSARYVVAVDKEFVVLKKDDVEYDRRKTSGFLALRTSMGRPRYRLEFVDEPALPIRWLAAWKVGKLENHLVALRGEAAVPRP